MMKTTVLAIDIGGTNVKAGLVDRQGRISNMIHRPSRAAQGRVALLGVLREVVQEQCACGNVVAIGAGSPGTINHAQGTVTYMQAHIPKWTGTPLARHLASWAGVPATIDNDVNLISLGEHWKGAGKGAKCLLVIALGTGLGGGIVIDGKLIRGARGRAPEFGHMVVRPGGEPCTCGNFGCAEVYAAPGAITRRAQYHLALGVPSALAAMRDFSAADIFKLAVRGDLLCLKLRDDAMQVLAMLVWDLCQAFDPDCFILGGGLTKAGRLFLDPLRVALAKYYCAPELEPMCPIKMSKLGDQAGIIGAAKLAWNWLDGVDR